ncbi:STAS domain-containing protein [Streptomyces minutiscleroticus]|uniref:STAS domain-containing protein n=1 Tax=Streptomyces minutiscleroticus TaxID=68238 RepID=A0A918NWF9_9ACTN|nr:STAS domain-containing protein [Streptomyces minutiscleroticus]GGY00657.1 hypothetical protein GCM10010358_63100 [Streptomyces minutiscleroticus]
MGHTPRCELVIRDVRTHDGAAFLSVVGELGLKEVQLLTEAVEQLTRGQGEGRRVVLDLSEVSYCGRDSACTLLGVCWGMEVVGIRVVIAEVSAMARLAFESTGVAEQLPLAAGGG